MEKWFKEHPRLGIPVPALKKDWENYSKKEQEYILTRWEKIRGIIPDQIKLLEAEIEQKQKQLNDEMDFQLSCQLNREISELASQINDLWILYRSSESLSIQSYPPKKRLGQN
ncbi:MAG: hypothetical protein H0Z32_08500 [Bacillaceae bacterium]|nr:hypothetical protein [Bacillaceae bacterium]